MKLLLSIGLFLCSTITTFGQIHVMASPDPLDNRDSLAAAFWKKWPSEKVSFQSSEVMANHFSELESHFSLIPYNHSRHEYKRRVLYVTSYGFYENKREFRYIDSSGVITFTHDRVGDEYYFVVYTKPGANSGDTHERATLALLCAEIDLANKK